MRTTTSLAIVLPSRGLVMSQTLESLYNNLANLRIKKKFFMTHDKPCPNAQEEATNEALEWIDGMGGIENSFILFFEEDMVFPKETSLKSAFLSFAEYDVGVYAFDYALKGGQSTVIYRGDNVFACGLGATIIRAEIVKEIPQPRFRTDMKFDLRSKRWIYSKPQPDDYGLFDVFFTYQAIKRCKKTAVSKNKAIHLELSQLGKSGVNNGCHTIQVKGTIERYIDIEKQ